MLSQGDRISQRLRHQTRHRIHRRQVSIQQRRQSLLETADQITRILLQIAQRGAARDAGTHGFGKVRDACPHLIE
jgi:hypothetical protein